VIGTGASLVARDVRVDGNVQAEGHRSVDVRTSRVGGSVQLKQGGAATVYRTAVGGDIQYDDNDRQLVAHSNPVGGNIQVVGNRGGVDGASRAAALPRCAPGTYALDRRKSPVFVSRHGRDHRDARRCSGPGHTGAPALAAA
jgi:hypothetical protein